jgi:hypothetical protein
MGIYKLRI